MIEAGNCTHGDHPGIVRAAGDEIVAHPERRMGHLMDGRWVSSLMLALACCSDAVCERIDRTAEHGRPTLHHPDVDCSRHGGG